MSARKLTKGLISSASAVALVAGVFIGANPASAAETPVTGGTLYFYTHNTQALSGKTELQSLVPT